MRLHGQEQEEVQLLRLRADGLREFRKKFLSERFD